MVSEMSLGTVQLGMSYGVANRVGMISDEYAVDLVRHALRLGITTFDTAPDYGRSEERLGQGLRASGFSDRVHVVSKLGAPAQAPLSMDDVRAWAGASIRRSLTRLGVARLSCLLVHRYTDLVSGGEALIQVLRELVDSGDVVCAGVSLYHPEELATALRNPVVRAVQIPINVLDQRWQRHGWLDRCADSGVAIFARSVFLQGLLLLAPEEAERKVPGSRPWLKRIGSIARLGGMSVRELALRYVLSLPGISSVVIGAETAGQISENVASFEAADKLDPSLMSELRIAFADIPVEIVSPPMWPQQTTRTP